MCNGYKSSIGRFLCFCTGRQHIGQIGTDSSHLSTTSLFTNDFHDDHLLILSVILKELNPSLKRGKPWLREVKGIHCLRIPGGRRAWTFDLISVPVPGIPHTCLLVLALELFLAQLLTQSKAFDFHTACLIRSVSKLNQSVFIVLFWNQWLLGLMKIDHLLEDRRAPYMLCVPMSPMVMSSPDLSVLSFCCGIRAEQRKDEL